MAKTIHYREYLRIQAVWKMLQLQSRTWPAVIQKLKKLVEQVVGRAWLAVIELLMLLLHLEAHWVAVIESLIWLAVIQAVIWLAVIESVILHLLPVYLFEAHWAGARFCCYHLRDSVHQR